MVIKSLKCTVTYSYNTQDTVKAFKIVECPYKLSYPQKFNQVISNVHGLRFITDVCGLWQVYVQLDFINSDSMSCVCGAALRHLEQ